MRLRQVMRDWPWPVRTEITLADGVTLRVANVSRGCEGMLPFVSILIYEGQGIVTVVINEDWIRRNRKRIVGIKIPRGKKQ